MFETFLALMPAIKAISPHLWTICCVIVALWCLLRDRALRRYLPREVSQALDEPYLQTVIRFCAQRLDLDNDAKRAEAAHHIDQFFQEKGIKLPERYVNMALEMLLHRLKAEGVLLASPPAEAEKPAAMRPL